MVSRFPYIFENTWLYVPSIGGIILGIIILTLLAIFYRYMLLYVQWFKMLTKERKTIEGKKRILWDLILMKDIQTELEAEIEQSMLKSTFQQ